MVHLSLFDKRIHYSSTLALVYTNTIWLEALDQWSQNLLSMSISKFDCEELYSVYCVLDFLIVKCSFSDFSYAIEFDYLQS
jgi:hypothetical protein